MAGGIARGELNVGKRVLLRGEVRAGVLASGHGDPSIEVDSHTQTSPDGSTTTIVSQSTLLSPGFEQKGVGDYEGAMCAIEVGIAKNFYAQANLLTEWQHIKTVDTGLNGVKGTLHHDSSSIITAGVGVGAHF
jgi:hypothetical protein